LNIQIEQLFMADHIFQKFHPEGVSRSRK